MLSSLFSKASTLTAAHIVSARWNWGLRPLEPFRDGTQGSASRNAEVGYPGGPPDPARRGGSPGSGVPLGGSGGGRSAEHRRGAGSWPRDSGETSIDLMRSQGPRNGGRGGSGG